MMDTHIPIVRRRYMSKFTLSDTLIVSLEDGLVDFQETRFRVLSHKFMSSIHSMAVATARSLNVDLYSLADISSEPEENLTTNLYCVFDFLDLSLSKRRGIIRSTWVPFAVFHNGNRILSLHASYKRTGPSLTGISLVSPSGEETHSSCTSINSAHKVCSSHLFRFFSH